MSPPAPRPTSARRPLHVLFDLDGTLADTAPDLGGAANDLLAELGHAPLPQERYRPECSKGARGMLAVALGLTPEDAGYESLRLRYLAFYAARLDRDTQLFPEVRGLLAKLDALRITWGIVTNKPMLYTRPVTQALGLATHAGCIVGGDSAARPKPAPDPLLLACELLKVAPEDCWYVGDDRRDMEAGRAAGMRVAAASWGYIGADTDPRHWNADALLHQPTDLLPLLNARHAD
ncbi:MAG: HAD family hydrolase [Nevskiaceae bacterium]|nr:MAG: HAD family hydrolase [Nevskiaceae bacterium]TBR74664.1 MAG: HAD family hydrolase [Nevskiaceae bacterium]